MTWLNWDSEPLPGCQPALVLALGDCWFPPALFPAVTPILAVGFPSLASPCLVQRCFGLVFFLIKEPGAVVPHAPLLWDLGD